MTRHWIPRRLRLPVSRVVEFVETRCASVWDGIVVVTPTIARRFPPGKTVLVQNFPIQDELIPIEPRPYQSRPSNIAYVGKIEGVRGAREMIRAMGTLPSSIDASLELAGVFEPKSLRAELEQVPGWERVRAPGWLSRSGITDMLAHARIGLVVLHPVENYLDAQPIKLFEYMAAGMAIVASDFPRWREMIGQVSCCVFVNPLDPSAIADAIQWLLEHPQEAEAMGMRGRQAVQTRFNWDSEGASLVRFYEEL
ncbi:MAG TPA: glycosyltransferase [Thermomicrobiales bacterium]|nr:glycosyltransferase [Thermomicrobiales bacterium]